MFRVVLAAYYLLLALAGPTPCCCSLSRLMTTITACVSSSDAVRFAWSDCCAPTLDDRAENSSDDSEESPTAPLQQRCECVKNSLCAIPERGIVLPASDSDMLMEFLLLASLNELPTVVVEDGWLGSDVGTPPLLKSGRALRIALCSWRC